MLGHKRFSQFRVFRIRWAAIQSGFLLVWAGCAPLATHTRPDPGTAPEVITRASDNTLDNDLQNELQPQDKTSITNELQELKTPPRLAKDNTAGVTILPTSAVANAYARLNPNSAGNLAPAPRAMTLENLEEIALNGHPVLKRDQFQIDSSRGSATQVGLFPNPHFDTNNPQVINGRNTALNAGFQQEVPVMGKKRLEQNAANQGTFQQEFNLKQDRANLLTSIRAQFYTVLLDQRRITVLTELVELTEKSVEIVKNLKKAGNIAVQDIILVENEAWRVKANLLQAKRILDGDRKQLEAIIGIPNLLQGELVGNISDHYPEFSEDQLLRYVGQEHTQIKIARSVVTQNELLLKRALVEMYPNPYLGPAYQFGLIPGLDQFWFNISFPIPVWDRNQGNIRAAKANVSAAVQNVSVIRNNLLNQAHNNYSLYKGALEVVKIYETQLIPKTKEIARRNEDSYKNGIIPLAQYYEALKAVVQTNIEYVNALGDVWNNATQIAGLLQLESFNTENPSKK